MLFRIFTLIAVAALAISTWILSSPARAPKAMGNPAQRELPGYFLKNATLTDYDEFGNPGLRLEAERIDQIAHGNEVSLYNVRVEYDPPGGQTWVMVGDVGHVRPGGQIVDVTGNVRLQGDSPGVDSSAVIHTDSLTYDIPDSIASTKSDVRIDFGEHMLTARGMAANLKERTLRLESRVNGRFHR